MIFCFSGCGNTLLVAWNLSKILGERVTRITINTPLKQNVTSHKRVIWMFPVYSWGVPREVIDFIAKSEIKGADTTEHFMVSTCGDDAGLTDKMWQKQIERRGWQALSAFTVIMPNTYVLLPGFNVDPETVAADKLKRLPDRVTHVAHAIKCHSRISEITRGKMPWLKTRILYPIFMKFLTSPRPFHHTDSCNGCGICSRTCPMGNVSIVNGQPQWGERCAMCLGCYHHCPKHSVAYGKITVHKGQYHAPAIRND